MIRGYSESGRPKPIAVDDDGTNPTTSVGMLLKNGASLVYDGSLSALRLIEVSASAKVNVAYYG